MPKPHQHDLDLNPPSKAGMRSRLWICSTALALPLPACATAEEVPPPAATPSAPVATRSPAGDPGPAVETPAPEPTLTFKNSRDLAILLEGPATGRSVGRFASRNEGVAVEFDAHVVAVTGSTVRLEYGDHDAARRTGPVFELRDVAPAVLGIEGELAEDDDVRLVARVTSYESESRLLLLDPVSLTRRS